MTADWQNRALADSFGAAASDYERGRPDYPVDAVTYGQAWHWVEPQAGSREAARVLTGDGVLGMVWNVRDPDVDWVAELTEIMHAAPGEIMATGGRPPFATPFTHAEERTWRWTRPMTHDDVVAMVASRSYLITAPEDDRRRIMAGVTELLAGHPALAGRATIDMPYVSRAWRVTR